MSNVNYRQQTTHPADEEIFMKKQKTRFQITKSDSLRMPRNKEFKMESYITLFDEYLQNQRGLAASSRHSACRVGRLFLHFTFKSKALHLSQIKNIDITSFISEYAQGKSPHYVQHIVYCFRSFLRFLKFKGLVPLDFSSVVPSIAIWGKDRIPDFLTEKEVKKLLKGCDTSTAIGLRDYAVIRLLLGLGLRAFEVSRLTLEDFDWDNGIVVIHGKGSKVSCLPLSQDLGDVLATYLFKRRPMTSSRSFFVSINKPFHQLKSQEISRI